MGKVLRFKYSGGSHPGEYRTVYFEDGNSGVGFDLDAEAVRSFLKQRMSDISTLESSVINTNILPTTLPASTIKAGWEADGKIVVRNGNLLIGYVKPVEQISHVQAFQFGADYGLDVQHGGRTVHVYKQKSDSCYGLYFYGPINSYIPPVVWEAKPADLLAALQWVVNG